MAERGMTGMVQIVEYVGSFPYYKELQMELASNMSSLMNLYQS